MKKTSFGEATKPRLMTSQEVAIREAKKMRARGLYAKPVFVTKGLGPGVRTWLVYSKRRKKQKK